MNRMFLALRDGNYLTRQRMTAWSCIMLVGFIASIAYLWLTAHGLNDYAGRPLGTDFSNVYAAGVQASKGHAAAPFDIFRQQQEEQSIFGSATPLYGWHYPPFFLLIAIALAQLPYLWALAVWQITTLLMYLAAVWFLLRKSAAPQLARDWLWPVLSLSFTAVWVNLTHGHNGFLTCALFASALAVLDERPILSGVLFGLLCYKPQFVLAIPLVLIATHRWHTLAASAVTVAILAIAVSAIFGLDVWSAFFAAMHFTRVVVLEQGSTGFYKIQSVFAWVRLWGGSVGAAYFVQTAVDLVIAIALVRVWRSSIGFGRKGAALCFATILMTPYCLDYDLMLLAPAIALLVAEGVASTFEPFEATLLATLWLLPIASRQIAHLTSIPVAVPTILAAFALIYRRRSEKLSTPMDIVTSSARI